MAGGGAAGRPVAWVTLDDGDDDAVVLWSHVIEALARTCPALRDAALADDGDRRTAARGAAAAARQRPRRAGRPRPRARRLPPPVERRGAGERRLVRRPRAATTQVVLATRTDPALPLGALRARGHLLELRADDLRFTVRRGRGVPQRPARARAARGGGRVAGGAHRGLAGRLYLAALSLEGKEDKAGLVRAFDGTSAHIVEFLSSEVLSAFDPALQEFMLRTSLLERLCADLCDAVLGRARFRGGHRAAGPQQPLPAPARRPPRVVPLPSPVRAAAAGGARPPRAGAGPESCTAAPPRGTPPRARRTRRSTMRSPPVRTPTPRRSSPGPGCTTSTRAGPAPSSTGWPGSRARSSTATRGCCSSRRGPPRCGAASTTCAARSPSPRSAATSRTGRCPTGSRRSPRASACCGRRSAGATSA